MRGLGPAIFLFIILMIASSTFISQTNPAYAGTMQEPIPDDAIRIRVIAQSDSAEDQAIKRAVRDRVAALIASWGRMPATAEEARAFLQAHLGEVKTAADEALRERNAPYGAAVEYGNVPFPEKTFQGKAYPAGRYEALRITLGQGAGANWWCVLFPPLCLTAATAKDDPAAAAETKAEAARTSAKSGAVRATEKSGAVRATETVGKAGAAAAPGADEQAKAMGTAGADAQGSADAGGTAAKADRPHAAFFLAVVLEKLVAWIGSLFS